MSDLKMSPEPVAEIPPPQQDVSSVEESHIGPFKLALIVSSLCLAVMLTGMDQTILATAAPTISDDFDALDDIAWWTDIYLLTLSSFQLFYGKLYTLFPIKTIYIAAIVLFELGSLICTTAPNSTALIWGRAVAGLGASGIFSGGVLITTKIIPLARRPAYLGVMSATFGVAAIVGPFVGGALADRSSWRWCFGINLPLGVVTIAVCVGLVRLPPHSNVRSVSLREKLREFDIPGTVLAVSGLVCLLLGLQWGGGVYSWNSPRVIALLTISGIILLLFVVLQSTSRFTRTNTIPPSIAKDYNIWLAASYAAGITGAIYVAIVYLPLWFQAIRNKSALDSGILLTPTIAGYVLASVIAGGATSAIGYYNPGMIIGTLLLIPGAALLSTIKPTTSTDRIIGYEVLFGLGAGFGFGQPSYIVQTLLPETDVPIGVTFITLVQNLSASIFIAVGQSVFQNGLRKDMVGVIGPEDVDRVLQGGARSVLESIPEQDRPRALDAYSAALIRTLHISLAMSCVTVIGAVGIRWQSMKSDKDNNKTSRSGGDEARTELKGRSNDASCAEN